MTLITQVMCCFKQIPVRANLTPEQHTVIGDFYYAQGKKERAVNHLSHSDERGDGNSAQLVSHALQELMSKLLVVTETMHN